MRDLEKERELLAKAGLVDPTDETLAADGGRCETGADRNRFAAYHEARGAPHEARQRTR
jgi:hypothetical protein